LQGLFQGFHGLHLLIDTLRASFVKLCQALRPFLQFPLRLIRQHAVALFECPLGFASRCRGTIQEFLSLLFQPTDFIAQ
jgi:hypothetical protein